MIKAIIFDMDGVITKTEAIQSTAESKVFTTIGIQLTPREIINKYSGWKDTDMFADVLRRYKVKIPVEKLRQEKWDIVYKVLAKKSMPAVPGALIFIEKLKQYGYILAIASSTNFKFISTVVSKLNIKQKFTVIVSGDEIKTGKPNPTIFLLASRKLGIPPKECLVIEDAPNGVKAAEAAGIKCIAITTSATRDELQGADLVIDSFDELSIEDIKNL